MLSVGMGSTGIHELLQRSLRSLTYVDYDLPLDIGKRGLEKVPNYHFRDDASEIWYAIMLYVKNVIGFFYSSDVDVLNDVEIQEWVKEIYRYLQIIYKYRNSNLFKNIYGKYL